MREPPLSILLILVYTVTVAACQPPSDTVSESVAPAAATHTPERDSVLSLLTSLKQDAFRRAFAATDEFQYTRRSRTTQFDAEGKPLARVTRTLRHEPGPSGPTTDVLQADTSGHFTFGLLGRFVSGGKAEPPSNALAQHLISDEPSYLSQRNREAYRYVLLPDTIHQGRPTTVVSVRARSDTGSDQAIRSVRIYIDKGTRELTAIDMERSNRGWLFTEVTQQYASIQRLDADDWLPDSTRFFTRVRIPLQPTRTFLTSSRYYDAAL